MSSNSSWNFWKVAITSLILGTFCWSVSVTCRGSKSLIGGVISRKRVCRIVNAFKDVDAIRDDSDCHVAHVQKAAQDTFCEMSAALVARL